MIAPASLPIAVEVPENYAVPDAALEALAMLLIEAVEAEDERGEQRRGAEG